jgi:hypothetical protein
MKRCEANETDDNEKREQLTVLYFYISTLSHDHTPTVRIQTLMLYWILSFFHIAKIIDYVEHQLL